MGTAAEFWGAGAGGGLNGCFRCWTSVGGQRSLSLLTSIAMPTVTA